MDKRTLYFAVAMSIALFAVNTFFSYLDQNRLQEWHSQEQARKEKRKAELVELNKKKSTEVSEFTIEKVDDVPFLQIGSTYVTKAANPPETVTLQGKSYQKVRTSQDFTLYTAAPSDRLPIKILPKEGYFELQLLLLAETPIDYYAEYKSGEVEIPARLLHLDFPDQFPTLFPAGTYIALVKQDHEWLVAGLYKSEKTEWIPIQELADLLQYTVKKDVSHELSTSGEEQFFVLENSFQQLVFSNRGGALAEINLPFQSRENRESVVREIQFDREMVRHHPQNAQFPLHSYYKANREGKRELVESGVLGGYYPLMRRSLMQEAPYETVALSPSFYAFNTISSEFAEVASQLYQVVSFTDREIVFESKQTYRRIRKTFSFPDSSLHAPYVVELKIEIEGDARGLYLTSGLPDVEWINGGIAPAIKYRMTHTNGKVVVENISLPSPESVFSSKLDWTCNSNGFFGMIVDPLGTTEPGFKALKIDGTLAPSRLVEIDQRWNRFKAIDMPAYAVQLPLSQRGGVVKFRLFAGPFATSILERVDAAFSDPETGYNPDYISSQSSHGWFTFISDPFAKFLFMLMKMFYYLTSSWGISIILLTLALRVMIYPLSQWSFNSMRKMQELSPSVKAIQEKYKNDSKKMNLEMAQLYRDKGVNPVSGCLPLLIQLPFLFGMFDLLKSAFELRGAPFIPGWINDLAAPDFVFGWSYPLFFIGTEFHLLPVLTGVVMLMQARLGTPQKDPQTMTEQERTQKAMTTMMSFAFALLFYNAPSGLCIYWIFSTLFGMVQQMWTNRRLPIKAVEVVQSNQQPVTKKNKKR